MFFYQYSEYRWLRKNCALTELLIWKVINNMNFNINFILNDNSQTNTRKVISSPDEHRDAINELYNLSCSIGFQINNKEWIIEDELGALIGNFFVKTVNDLATKGSSQYEYFEMDGRISSEKIDGTILISGDFVEDLELPIESFETLTKNLAAHAIEFLECLNNAKYQADIDFIKEKLAEGRL